MKDVHAVSVMYHGRKVGTLSMGNRSNCQFEYDKDWLTDGFSISPLKLPLKAGLFTADYQPFNGNFGVFEDSLPIGSNYKPVKYLYITDDTPEHCKHSLFFDDFPMPALIRPNTFNLVLFFHPIQHIPGAIFRETC